MATLSVAQQLANHARETDSISIIFTIEEACQSIFDMTINNIETNKCNWSNNYKSVVTNIYDDHSKLPNNFWMITANHQIVMNGNALELLSSMFSDIGFDFLKCQFDMVSNEPRKLTKIVLNVL